MNFLDNKFKEIISKADIDLDIKQIITDSYNSKTTELEKLQIIGQIENNYVIN